MYHNFKNKTQAEQSLIVSLLKQREIQKARFALFKIAIEDLRRNAFIDEPTKNAISIIYGAMYEQLNKANEQIFMFSAIFPEELRKKAVEMAAEEYLTENHDLMHYLLPIGQMTGTHLSSDSELLQKAVQDAIKKQTEEKESALICES